MRSWWIDKILLILTGLIVSAFAWAGWMFIAHGMQEFVNGICRLKP